MKTKTKSISTSKGETTSCKVATSSSFGVDVCLEALSDNNALQCPHGPAVLFERFTKSGIERFYACAASRDRKFCRFYLKEEEFRSLSAESVKSRQEKNAALQPKLSHGQAYRKTRELLKLAVCERRFCLDCGMMLLSSEHAQHKTHNIKDCDLIDSLLATPTKLLLPLENKKTNAQYLFSESTTTFIVKTLIDLKFTKFLCVGVPRIHEYIQTTHPQLGSFLLDIDHRYEQFYGPEKFQRYNMFNNHLFRGDRAKMLLRSFLLQDTGNVVLVTDPPFGGLAELLHHSVQQIESLWRETNSLDSEILPVMWIFPYYLENRVKAVAKGYHMLDYKVEYENHKAFKNTKSEDSHKKGSAVRIFTNISPQEIVLPPEEGYRLCQKCERYVSRENRHCDKCDSCTSKDGSTYVHCDKCGRCVKPRKVHCDRCRVCDIPDAHRCASLSLPGCHICGSRDHKRMNCPERKVQASKLQTKSQTKKKRRPSPSECEGQVNNEFVLKKKKRKKTSMR